MNRFDTRIVPQELLPGARNAVRTCLAIGGGDRVAILTDLETERVGRALKQEAESAGATAELFLLEDFGERPFTSVPEGLPGALHAFEPTAGFFAAQGQKGEIGFRIPLRHLLIDELNLRYGHMIGVDEQLMVEGMMADYEAVARLVQRVTDLVATAREIRVTNPKGTDLRVTFSPELRWKPCPGIYRLQGEWGNLPEGETYTCPSGAEGVLVADVLGDYFSKKYGVLDRPVSFEIEGGVIKDVICENQDIQLEVDEYLHSDENSDRVGEFAIGANLWVRSLTGNLLQDEKIPGVHVAFGNPYPEETGAKWDAR
ncbi:MAG TPA: aminopeptidase, partial [Chloroflexota bacterium]